MEVNAVATTDVDMAALGGFGFTPRMRRAPPTHITIENIRTYVINSSGCMFS